MLREKVAGISAFTRALVKETAVRLRRMEVEEGVVRCVLFDCDYGCVSAKDD